MILTSLHQIQFSKIAVLRTEEMENGLTKLPKPT